MEVWRGRIAGVARNVAASVFPQECVLSRRRRANHIHCFIHLNCLIGRGALEAQLVIAGSVVIGRLLSALPVNDFLPEGCELIFPLAAENRIGNV